MKLLLVSLSERQTYVFNSPLDGKVQQVHIYMTLDQNIYCIIYLGYSLAYSIPLHTKDQRQKYPLLGWTSITEKDAKDYLLPFTGNPDFCPSFHLTLKNIINARDGKTSPKCGCHEKISNWRKMEIIVIIYQCNSYTTVYVPRPGKGQKRLK